MQTAPRPSDAEHIRLLQEQICRGVLDHFGKKSVTVVSADIHRGLVNKIAGHPPGVSAYTTSIRFEITPKMGETLGLKNRAVVVSEELAQKMPDSPRLHMVTQTIEKGEEVTIESKTGKPHKLTLALFKKLGRKNPILMFETRLDESKPVEIHLSTVRIAPSEAKTIVSISSDDRLKKPIRDLAEFLSRTLDIDISHHV